MCIWFSALSNRLRKIQPFFCSHEKLLTIAISVGTEDSIPKPTDIRFNVVSLVTKRSLCPIYQLSNCAMLNYDIIEREESVIMLMCLFACLAAAARSPSTLLQDILVDLLTESLTTILFLHTYMWSFFIIPQITDYCNSSIHIPWLICVLLFYYAQTLSFIQSISRSRCTTMRLPIWIVGKPLECISV